MAFTTRSVVFVLAIAARPTASMVVSSVQLPPEPVLDMDECQATNVTFKERLRHTHFFCAGVEKYWNGTMCQCSLRQVQRDSLELMRTAAADVPELSPSAVSEAAVNYTSTDSGGTRAYLPQCRADSSKRVPALFYRNLLHSGNTEIKLALQKIGEMKDNTVAENFWEDFHLCEKLEERRQAAKGKEDGPLLFAFVRDPVDHLLGVYEAALESDAFKTYEQGAEETENVGSFRRFTKFVEFILGGGHIPGTAVLQSQMLHESSCTSRFDFIGKMEFATYDWKALSLRVGCSDDTFPFPMEIMKTAVSSADVVIIKEMLAKEEGAALQKVLCWLLLPDYAVFDYPIPLSCQSGDFQQIF